MSVGFILFSILLIADHQGPPVQPERGLVELRGAALRDDGGQVPLQRV